MSDLTTVIIFVVAASAVVFLIIKSIVSSLVKVAFYTLLIAGVLFFVAMWYFSGTDNLINYIRSVFGL